MTKPFHKTELIARVHAIVRRSQGHAQSVVQTGDLSVNVDAKTVHINQVGVNLREPVRQGPGDKSISHRVRAGGRDEHGKPPKTPDNSSLPPSRGQKGNVAELTRVKKARKQSSASLLAVRSRNQLAKASPHGSTISWHELGRPSARDPPSGSPVQAE